MNGIFVNGAPLREFIDKEETEEIKNDLKQELSYMNKIKDKRPGKPKNEIKYIKHSRVRIMSDEEIRKEKGIMAKPFTGEQTKNALYLLREKGPLSTSDLSKLLNVQFNPTTLIKMCKLLPNHIIRSGKPNRFQILVDPNEIWVAYLEVGGGKRGRRKSQIITKPNEKDIKELSTRIKNQFKEKLLENLPSQIKVIVEGEVKIRFILG